VTAVRCGAHISTVLVHKPGLGMFDFAAVNAKLDLYLRFFKAHEVS